MVVPPTACVWGRGGRGKALEARWHQFRNAAQAGLVERPSGHYPSCTQQSVCQPVSELDIKE